MKRTLLVLLLVSFFFAGCNEEDNPYAKFEQERLAQLISEKHEAIRQLAQPVSCADSSEWKLTDIQSECGTSYIAYHQSTDERKLKDLINDHDLAMEIYRSYVLPYISCAPYREPTGIACADGKAVVQYQEPSN